MSNPLKIALYIVLAIVAGVSGYYALRGFGQMMDRAGAGARISELEQVEPERKPSTEEAAAPPAPATKANATPAPTPLSTNAAALTNALALLSNQAATSAATNTNAVAEAAAPPAVAEATTPLATAKPKAAATRSGGGTRIGLWTALFLLSVIALGFLIASDVSNFMGNRALDTIYNDDGEGVKNPEYEEAEQVWAKGQHLEAIGLMREYLQKNPREQHVALRIAEIYEKDLHNHLAAALEYEEVLKHKLAPERWSWAAIHLCNLYFKLNQEEKGYELLRRIVKEHPDTPAAEKARKRLEQIGDAAAEPLPTERQLDAAPAAGQAAPTSNLPPGFRPKK